MKHSETLRALMEENETNNKKSAQRDARGLKEARPAAPVKMVASNPHFKVSYTSHYYLRLGPLASVMKNTQIKIAKQQLIIRKWIGGCRHEGKLGTII